MSKPTYVLILFSTELATKAVICLTNSMEQVPSSNDSHLSSQEIASQFQERLINHVLRACHWTLTLMPQEADSNLGCATGCPDEVSGGILNLHQGSSEIVLSNRQRPPLSSSYVLAILCNPSLSYSTVSNKPTNQQTNHRKARFEALTSQQPRRQPS
jgi:hypothetical protein